MGLNLDTYAKTLTVVMRVFGVFALAAGPVFFLSAFIDPSNRVPFILAGILVLGIGIGCLRGTAITREQIEKFPKR